MRCSKTLYSTHSYTLEIKYSVFYIKKAVHPVYKQMQYSQAIKKMKSSSTSKTKWQKIRKFQISLYEYIPDPLYIFIFINYANHTVIYIDTQYLYTYAV